MQVGALEYDPELYLQQHHRDFLREKVVFKEVVPIADPALRAKIHQTYRLAYLKDVVLPRVLDDATFATFSSLILFNNVEVRSGLVRSWQRQRLGTAGWPLPSPASPCAHVPHSAEAGVEHLQELRMDG